MRVFSLLLILFIACPASAQPDSPHPNYVIYSVEGRVPVENKADVPNALPISLLQQLDAQDAMARLEVNVLGPAAEVKAHFVFRGFDAFRTWYETETTKTLLRTFETNSPSRLRTTLVTRRGPYLSLLEDRSSQ